MNCPECDTRLSLFVEDKEDYFHMFEKCSYCGFQKAYVDYKNDDTGELDYSGIEH